MLQPKEWGEKDDSLLLGPRVGFLTKDVSGLKLCTEGYQWWKSQKIGTFSILKVDSKNKFTVLGTSIPAKKVDNIWVVESKTNTMPGSDMDLAKMRMKLRGSPSYASFDHYVKIRTSCCIIEEADGEFYCDCPI